MNDNSSYIGPSAPLDDKTVDAYELIQGSLQLQEDSESFMDIVTTTMIFEPSLITMENILFIIDDKRSRHPKTLKQSGRQMLQAEFDLLELFMENTDGMIEYYYEKFEWDETNAIHDPDELIVVFHQVIYAYQLCYWLRDYVSTNNKLYSKLQQTIAKLQEQGKVEKIETNSDHTSDNNLPDY
jgi:hypothetical protein